MPAKTFKRRLADVLLEQELISEAQLRECIALQRSTGESLANLLLHKRFIEEEVLVAAFSEQLQIPYIRVANYKIPPEVLAAVPEPLACQHQVLPISVKGNSLTLAMADPQNLVAIDDIRGHTGYDIEPVVAMASELTEAIERNYSGKQSKEKLDDIIKSAQGADQVDVVQTTKEVEDITALKTEAQEAPVIRLVNLMLSRALEGGASDIHVEPFEKTLRIRYREDGVLEEQESPPKHVHPALVSRLKIMAECDIAEHRVPQDGRFRIRFRNREVDFRISFLPCYYGEKVVMRILDKGNLALDLDALGFEPQPLEAFKEALKLPFGMILVTGPTGSGKSTTLYSALHKLNEVGTNIVTVEDPVEYELYGVNQVAVKTEVKLTFAAALRSILRQDPDIVMVGEIRDNETADIAIKAALTGHLVLSTLHTNDAASVFTRLIDMSIEPFLVQSSMVLAAAQRLMRRVCPDCKQPIKVPQEVLERIQYYHPKDAPPPQFVRGRGCASCKESGYKGRMAVIEALPNYPQLQELVMKSAPAAEIKRVAMSCGMRSLRQNALAKAARGLTSIEEVLRVTAPD